MNWEQVLKNIGAMSGLIALMIVWIGQALWMRIEADKRGMMGWIWAFIGILVPPFGLFFFLFWRMRYPVQPEVAERDEMIEEVSRRKIPFYRIMDEKAGTAPEPPPGEQSEQDSIRAAMEAEERRFRNQ